MTIQDLINYQEEIEIFAEEKEININRLMSFLSEAIEMGMVETEDVMEFVHDSWYYVLRNQKTSKVAEAAGRAKESGNYEFDLNKYYASKN